MPHPQHRHYLLQLLVEEVDETLLPLDEDGAPDDLALAVGDEVIEPLHLFVQLCQRLLVHVYLAAGVGDVQGGLSNVAVKFGKMCHLRARRAMVVSVFCHLNGPDCCFLDTPRVFWSDPCMQSPGS